jgi:hypothetical protein
VFLVSQMVAFCHAWFSRDEYLFRMEALEKTGQNVERKIQGRIEAEYGVNLTGSRFRRQAKGPGVMSRCSFSQALLLADGPPARHWETTEAFGLYQPMAIMHLIALGKPLDATKDFPDLIDVIDKLEREGQIEIDVAKAAYQLTPEGKRYHGSWLYEAQDLIKRYDIFGDVKRDGSGADGFDSGMGKDFRVPFYELDSLNPFKARFLVGLADGEWDALPNWWLKVATPAFFGELFAVVETAPTVDAVGRGRMMAIQANAQQALANELALVP